MVTNLHRITETAVSLGATTCTTPQDRSYTKSVILVYGDVREEVSVPNLMDCTGPVLVAVTGCGPRSSAWVPPVIWQTHAVSPTPQVLLGIGSARTTTPRVRRPRAVLSIPLVHRDGGSAVSQVADVPLPVVHGNTQSILQ